MRNEVISSQLNNIDDVKNLCQLKVRWYYISKTYDSTYFR